MPILLQQAAELPSGYGAALLQSLLALFAVCILAWVVLRWASKRGMGIGRGRHVRVVERVALDARRHLYIVEVGGKTLLLGSGDGAAPRLLTELDAAELKSAAPKAQTSFRDVLARLSGRSDEEEADALSEEGR
ncbi:MAG: flagellar biosynthetic protein FliO [Myxococcota bacterium]